MRSSAPLGALTLALVPALVAQPQPVFSFSDVDAPLTVEADVYWGNLTVTGDAEDTVRLSVTHTALQGQPTPVTAWADYVTVEQIGNILRVRGRRPAPGTFESVDLTLHVPARARLLLPKNWVSVERISATAVPTPLMMELLPAARIG